MKKESSQLVITGNTFYADGYTPAITSDGYQHKFQLNVKLTGEDMQSIMDINDEFFDREITNSTLARILIRRGIKSFQNLK
jgi:hypothetical protein